MHSPRRPRAGIFFEALCVLAAGASFAGAWEQTGASAFLGTAAVCAIFALYRSAGLFTRNAAVETAAAVPAAVTEAPVATEREPEIALAPAPEPEREPATAFEAEPARKPRAKTRPGKARAAKRVAEPIVEVAAIPDERPIEQLFDPQPFVRQQRPAFGRRDRFPRPLPSAPGA